MQNEDYFNLIYTTQYILEITAIDGYKNYDTILVVVKSNYVKSLSPNPASKNLNEEYVVDEDTGFTISIMNNSGVVFISQDKTVHKSVSMIISLVWHT